MAFATARPLSDARIDWTILAMVLRVEGEFIRPQLETLVTDLTTLQTEIQTLHETLSDLALKVDHLLVEATRLVEDTQPLWDDSYNLCGNPQCDGDCRVCQEGEYDGEEEYVEKYCRRGKR